MARAELTLQTIARAGIDPTFVAAEADGHAFDNASKRVFLVVKNGSGASIDVTIQTPGDVDGLAIADRIVSVPASDEKWIGAFPNIIYAKNDTTLGIDKAVWVDYSSTSSVTVSAIKLPAV